MPNTDHPRARRRWLVAPYILLALAVAGWSGWWLYLRAQVAERLDETAAAMRSDGYEVSWSGREISGYPFRVLVVLKDVRLSEPTGYGLSAALVEAQSAAYNINPVVIAAPQGAVIRRPGDKAFTINGKVLRASISHADRTPPRISVEGQDLQFGAFNGAQPLSFSAMKRLEVHLRPGDGDTAQIFVRLDRATPANNALLTRVANGSTVTLGLEGAINGASFLRGDGWAKVLGNWSAAKGSLDVTKGGIIAGEAVLSVMPSKLSIDRNGRLAGDLALSLSRAPQGVMALGAVGVLPQETAAVASGFTGMQPSGKPLETTLSFRNGQTWIGPLPLGDAPKVY